MSDIEKYLENPIKRHIITTLLKKARRKYSELQPVMVDNVLFNYHLQHLVKAGVLIKEGAEYYLSPEGIKLTSSIAYDGVYFPKFVCRYKMYVIDEAGGKVLLQKRYHAPWRGDVTAISSKVLMGTPTKERANVRIKESTGLDVDMQVVGTVRQMVHNAQGDLLDDCVYFVCYSTKFSGELKEVGGNQDSLMWLSFDEAKAAEANNKGSGPAAIQILDRFEKGDFSSFFFEEAIVSEMF
jgi:hypothetical protein